ncbi:hypothetical protein EV198_2147 [Roseivirga ehrenbergii]|uniref:Uncharacterized protein n=1 Tax=Roseivirga ehrenbergii (strain DSM 102268 / JCM 13514 / KCTC 12282 / NCIMB 14502 / KMM 6017) TaxID=279360 RepID=A0A150WYN4_ROSEK|nr:hypothetical protein [Roseivirga ehrenbergii]KYG71598.1 hypothetical protein MB14_09775 [Roseivirga ehrenbergii]TCL07714.1 hypothetical protein EV198_2147 [Roseivirga ehrenbergii]
MKFLLPIFILTTLFGQGYGVITISDFASIKINQSISLDELLNIDENWSELKNKLGQPSTEKCEDQFVEQVCNFTYAGATVKYTDLLGDFYLSKASFTKSSFVFRIKGVDVKVGDSISKLSNIFPNEYQKGLSSNRLLFHVADMDISLSFNFNPSTNKISEILIFQAL